ncbi:MAG: hypothetical protein Q8M40_12145 [Legionella sp.]|nr:hypothetical protein [Legionella sp.]
MVAKIREELGIKGMGIPKAMLLSNKNLMYEKINNRISYPKIIQLSNNCSFSSCKKLLNSSEIFIKPTNMTGSYKKYHVKSEMDFHFFLTNKLLELQNYIAQPYINADLYHSELVVFNGEILFISARKYPIPNHLMIIRNKPTHI